MEDRTEELKARLLAGVQAEYPDFDGAIATALDPETGETIVPREEDLEPLTAEGLAAVDRAVEDWELKRRGYLAR